MTQYNPPVDRFAGPTVHRAERGKDVLGASHAAELTRLNEERYAAQAEVFAHLDGLARRVREPTRRMIEQDADARAALAEYRQRRRAALEARVNFQSASRTFGGPQVGSLIPRLHRGVNVFAPPFDFQVTSPTKGDVSAWADRFSGTFGVSLPWDKGGARWATAGVGLVLTAGVAAVAHVRPAWHYDSQGIAFGDFLDSHTEGAGKLVVQDAVTGALLMEPKWWPLWNFDNDDWQDHEGYVDSWALAADFFVQAGQVFTVSLLATAMVHDSGTDYLIGYSLASARIEMRVPLMVVELGPG